VCAADVALTGQLGPGSFLRFALAE
jgi:hypothetical protein